MTNIKDHYNNILARQAELDYRMVDFLRPPADLSEIKISEKELGFTFNDELIQLFLFSNGVLMNNDSYDEYLIPFHRLLGLQDSVSYYQSRIEFSDSFQNYTSDFKPGTSLFPFLIDDAGNTYWVDLNSNIKENFGKIFWTNSWGDEPNYKYSSLTSMFKTINDAYVVSSPFLVQL